MINKVSVNLNQILNPKRKKYNILTVPTHEGYQSMLDNTGHNFYMIQGNGLKTWDFQTRDLPPNHYLYMAPLDQIRSAERYDMILCQNRVQQWDTLFGLSLKMGLPLIVLDHTEIPPVQNQEQLNELLKRTGDINIFITEHNKEKWHNPMGKVIPHGIDTEVFQGYNPTINKGVSVVNKFADRDFFCGWNLWNEIRNGGANVDLYGDNPGLSESINDTEELASKLSQYRYFLNTSQYSPIPLSLMEAMSVGLPIVTTAKQEIPKIIKHNYNGLISNDPKELISYCKELEKDEAYAKELGANARKTILEEFSIDLFTERWNKVFDEAYQTRKK